RAGLRHVGPEDSVVDPHLPDELQVLLAWLRRHLGGDLDSRGDPIEGARLRAGRGGSGHGSSPLRGLPDGATVPRSPGGDNRRATAGEMNDRRGGWNLDGLRGKLKTY